MTAVLSHRMYWHTSSHTCSSLVVLSLRQFHQCLGILRSIDWRELRLPGEGWQRRKANDGKPPCRSGSPTSIVSASILLCCTDKEISFMRVIVSPTPNRRLQGHLPLSCSAGVRFFLQGFTRASKPWATAVFPPNPGRSPCSSLRHQDRASKRKQNVHQRNMPQDPGP